MAGTVLADLQTASSLEDGADLGRHATMSSSTSMDEETTFNTNSTCNPSKIGKEGNFLNDFVCTHIFWVCLVLLVIFSISSAIVNLDRAWPLLCLCALIIVRCVWVSLNPTCGRTTDLQDVVEKHQRFLMGTLLVVACIVLISWIMTDAVHDAYRLVPLSGLVFMVGCIYATSIHRNAVKWRPVLSGLLLQMVLGILIMRTRFGFELFKWLGDRMIDFFNHVDLGCNFVFGPEYTKFYFAFRVLPIIIYFGSVTSIAFYMGWLQWIFGQVAWMVQLLMGTSALESFVAAANIFISMTEVPLLVKPFLHKGTNSELHAIMTCGFATIAGGVFATYMSFGVPAQHLIAASVMSCPAALAVSKLNYPETQEPAVNLDNVGDLVKLAGGSEDHSVIEAAANGASNAVMLVVNIAANLIAFLAIWSLLNGAIGWAGSMVDIEGLSIELLCSYIFWPLAFVMGVPFADCFKVARLIGEKTFINEFVAYRHLADLVSEGVISKRAEVIATYALCGFSNIGSLGVMLGGLCPLVPSRRQDMTSMVVRAMLCGTVACFMTACFAGMFFKD